MYIPDFHEVILNNPSSNQAFCNNSHITSLLPQHSNIRIALIGNSLQCGEGESQVLLREPTLCALPKTNVAEHFSLAVIQLHPHVLNQIKEVLITGTYVGRL